VTGLVLKHIVEDSSDGRTVKYILKNKMNLSERLVKEMKNAWGILCNGVPVRINTIIHTGDIVEAHFFSEDKPSGVTPENMALDILYEDDWLIAVNKPAGMIVHPVKRHQSGTLANGLLHYLQLQGKTGIIRPVSRLDKNTSGVILFAMNPYVQQFLTRHKQSTFHKEYTGVVYGIIQDASGVIDLSIERKPDSIMERQISLSGKPSVTRFHVLERLAGASVLRFILETGRTHQIRVHCQAIGHPLVGDTLYGLTEIPGDELPQDISIKRQALHSSRVKFKHPADGRSMEITAPLPDDITALIHYLSL
jgi:23S rRNA pseudouridine1911/1915/1917 synthase